MAPHIPCALRGSPALRSAVSRQFRKFLRAGWPLGSRATGPSASLGILAVAYGYACELPPSIWPRGARAEGTETTECSQVKPARPTCAEAP